MTQLPEVIGFVEAFCQREGVGRRDQLRLTLVLEELFTNTVEHGHGGDCDAPVRVELGASIAEVALLYEDVALPFDPLAHGGVHPPNLEASLDKRADGGLGIYLVDQLAADARYARENGRNRLWIVLRRED
jgi:serine/threonine-protein kinase RsbW